MSCQELALTLAIIALFGQSRADGGFGTMNSSID
jgi:hypothetical protein